MGLQVFVVTAETGAFPTGDSFTSDGYEEARCTLDAACDSGRQLVVEYAEGWKPES